jgi:TonB family protein
VPPEGSQKQAANGHESPADNREELSDQAAQEQPEKIGLGQIARQPSHTSLQLATGLVSLGQALALASSPSLSEPTPPARPRWQVERQLGQIMLEPAHGDGAGMAWAAGSVEPKLEIAWGSFHGGRWSHFAALFGPSAEAGWRQASPFRDSWVEGRVPKRAVVAATLWHVAILALPISLFTAVPRRNVALRNIEVSWQGPIDDLPLLNIEREKARPVPKAEPQKSASTAPKEQPEIEAFHPRQRIFTDPVHPTHPRQTLINPAAPFEAPKLLPTLPNMVEFQQAGPARPRLQISEEMLAKLRPREKQATTTAAAPVDAPLMEQRVGEMNLPTVQNGPARPKLEINAGAAPRVAQRAQNGETVAAPDVGSTQITAANGGANALIALSATPGPPAPVQPPQGNLAARIAMSPEGKPGGAAAPPAPGNGSGKGGVAVSISGGDPPDSSRNAKIAAPTPRVLITRPEPKVESEDLAERTAPPDFAALPPSAKPESIFASKKVYTMNVNMPNLNSSTGSWILNFSELRTDSSRPRYAASPTDLSGPVPVKKVDPKYPPTLISERVQGEVVLYAVIRRDGSVDSIQLVRGIDEQLDANAMKALAQWQFRPAAKQGTPVELEAIVHIPFRLPEYR